MLTEHMLKKNKLKITIVCDVLGEENNGTTIAAMNLIRYLRQAGHEVHVLCPDKTKKDLEGYYVVPTRSFGVFTGYIEKNGVSLAKADDKTVRAAINGSDVVHIMLPFTLGKKAIQVAKEMNIPITTGFHLLAENFSSHIFMKDAKFTNRLLYSYFHSAYKECDAIHYPTQYLRDLNEKMYGKTNGYVISNGVNDMFRPLPDKKPFDGIYRIVYTGKVDEFYDYRYGKLDYRTVRFEEEVVNTPNYQGNAVVNYTDSEVPFTRIIEHKHFEMFGDAVYDCPQSVISREYSMEWKDGMEPYYPVNDLKNNALYERYKALAERESMVLFGGRLAEYKYYDMAPIIEKVFGLTIL